MHRSARGNKSCAERPADQPPCESAAPVTHVKTGHGEVIPSIGVPRPSIATLIPTRGRQRNYHVHRSSSHGPIREPTRTVPPDPKAGARECTCHSAKLRWPWAASSPSPSIPSHDSPATRCGHPLFTSRHRCSGLVDAAIARARELRAIGLSLRAVALRLAVEGHVSCMGRAFFPSQVARMLTTPCEAPRATRPGHAELRASRAIAPQAYLTWSSPANASSGKSSMKR
jgi:hypothetical protein